jgi:hypothetical protein
MLIYTGVARAIEGFWLSRWLSQPLAFIQVDAPRVCWWNYEKEIVRFALRGH